MFCCSFIWNHLTLRGSTHKLRRSVPSTSFSSWYSFSTGLEKALLGRLLTKTNESVHQYKNLLTTQNPRIKGQKEAWMALRVVQCEMFWLLWPCFDGTTGICPGINGIFTSICLRRTKTKAAGMSQMVYTKIGLSSFLPPTPSTISITYIISIYLHLLLITPISLPSRVKMRE